jgi:hypothetical protein
MSHTLNTIYLESAYQKALEYGLTELEAGKFAQEMLEDSVPFRSWDKILTEAVFWSVDGEKAKEDARYA